jgi:hypothetical protein
MTTAQQERIEELEEALRQIAQWSDAYPLRVFPELTSEQWKSAEGHVLFIIDELKRLRDAS